MRNPQADFHMASPAQSSTNSVKDFFFRTLANTHWALFSHDTHSTQTVKQFQSHSEVLRMLNFFFIYFRDIWKVQLPICQLDYLFIGAFDFFFSFLCMWLLIPCLMNSWQGYLPIPFMLEIIYFTLWKLWIWHNSICQSKVRKANP